MKIKRGMIVKNKTTGKFYVIHNRASGNGHWNISTMKGPNHRIHEGTFKKFYEAAYPQPPNK